jgi:1-deoxy-D-xylulose-5-phosphate reductoisomerase
VEQATRLGAKHIVTASESQRQKLSELCLAKLGGTIKVSAGEGALCEMVSRKEVEVVLASVVGLAGLSPVLSALEAGKRVALANKESLVAGGPLVQRALASSHGTLVPVDSEHHSLFQLLRGASFSDVSEIVLTASGGPFLRRSTSTLSSVTPQEAVRHPRWSMGAKISVDSATLMNKGLELIEAHWLFGFPESQIRVLIHPQSIVHGIVRLRDGSEIAHLSNPDMAGAIAAAMAFPQHVPKALQPLDLASRGTLTFEEVDSAQFPAIGLARAAVRAGSSTSAVLNSANEEAVSLFLDGALKFHHIVPMVERALEQFSGQKISTLEELYLLDQEVRQFCRPLQFSLVG